jgi:subtilisin-like proprotein convertase family protein
MLALMVMMSSAVMAQTETQSSSPNVAIGDDLYMGTLANPEGFGVAAGMTCTTMTFSGGITNISDVEMDLALTHTWIGDLTVKLQSPAGTIVAPLVRPTGDATNPPLDDGSGCCGDSDDIAGGVVNFNDGAATDAETMGFGGAPGNITGPFFPNNDQAVQNAGSFSAFAGEDADGVWTLCVGDSAGGDLGTLNSVSVTVTGSGGGGCEQSLSATLSNSSPPAGSTITFTVTVTNSAASSASLDLWLDATGPVSRRFRLASGTLPAGVTVTRNVPVRIPGAAPAGSYSLDLNIGDFATDDICDTVNFPITVTAPVVGGDTSASAQWEADASDFFSADAATQAVTVAPNPFVGQTRIAYEVEVASDVRLAVYDVLGREVAVLVDANVQAGSHTATFDARGLAAGTYVYRLVVGNDVQTGRLTLAQ